MADVSNEDNLLGAGNMEGLSSSSMDRLKHTNKNLDEQEPFCFNDEDDDEFLQISGFSNLTMQNSPLMNDSMSLDSHHNTDDLILSMATTNCSNVSYFYLRNELGLSEEDMWRITFQAPSVLGMTSETIRRKVNLLRDTLNLSNIELRTMLSKAPAILHLSADNNIAPTLAYLTQLLDLKQQELKALLLACPPILGYSQDNLRAKVNFFTNSMGFTVDETRALYLKDPRLFRSSVRTGLSPHLKFFVRDLHLKTDVVRKIVFTNPRILLYSLDLNLVPKLIFFCIMTLHMENSHLEKLLLLYPQFLDYNLDQHTLPIVRYFLQDLDFNAIEFRSILLSYPRIVTNALSKIKYNVGFLRYEFGFSGSQVKRVLYQAPQVVCLRNENLRNKLIFLQQVLVLQEGEVQTLIAGMPRLLVLNVERNLRPKIEYLLEAFGEDKKSLSAALLRLPTLLGYSLAGRIRPRMEAILSEPNALDPSAVTIGISMKQDKFDAWLASRKNAQRRARASDQDQLSSAEEAVSEHDALLPILSSDPSGRIFHWTRERRPRK